MEIVILDYTANWSAILPEVRARWDAALAFRGIEVWYERRPITHCDEFVSMGQGVISVCDLGGVPGVPNQLGEGGYEAGSQPWLYGYVRLFMDPNRSPTLAMACAVHEIGHALMLNHQTEQPSVMTPIPRLAYPSTWDAMNAMPGYPLPEPAPSPPPAPKKKKSKHKKHKH